MAYSNTIRNTAGKFLHLSLKDKIKTVFYIISFHFFILLFKLLGYKKTKNLIDKVISTRNNSKNNNFILNESQIIGHAFSNSLFKSTCLERSLFTYLILGTYGIKTELKIGVNNAVDEFSAHAWVEHDGIILNDTPETLKNISPF